MYDLGLWLENQAVSFPVFTSEMPTATFSQCGKHADSGNHAGRGFIDAVAFNDMDIYHLYI